MKKLFLVAGLMAGMIAFASPVPEPTARVLKAFKETFGAAKDITWHEYNDFIQANFHQNEIQVRAQYADDGTLLKTIRYYGENNLQPNIVAKLKKKFKDKEIFGVTETMCAEEVSFTINLRDSEHWYTVTSKRLINSNVPTVNEPNLVFSSIGFINSEVCVQAYLFFLLGRS